MTLCKTNNGAQCCCQPGEGYECPYEEDMKNDASPVSAEEMKSRLDQPPPKPNDLPAISDLVIADMQERAQVGLARYGTPLQPHNGRDALVDAYQEAQDLTMYLRQAIYERDGPLQKPNDLQTEMMAMCMAQTRDELIEAGIFDKSVPPMFVTDAVLGHIGKLKHELAERGELTVPEHWKVVRLNRDEFRVECPGAAMATVSVMSHDPTEMLLAFLAEMMVTPTVQADHIEDVRDGWQPIETAPKGGGADLVTDPKWVDPPKILLRFGDEAVSVAYWDWYYAEGGNGYRDGFAWVEPCSGERLNLHYTTPPTHWMLLPEPPAASQPNKTEGA